MMAISLWRHCEGRDVPGAAFRLLTRTFLR